MSRNRNDRGDDFLEGRIADENLEHGRHRHGGHCHDVQLPITLICGGTVGGCGPQIGPGCCWTVLATTDCTTSRPNGATCCWRLLATTDCTTTVGGAACCWIILGTTNCTTTQGGGDCD